MRRGVLYRDDIIDGQVDFTIEISFSGSRWHSRQRGGHPGRDRTLSLRYRFYRPGMSADVDQSIKGCRRCL